MVELADQQRTRVRVRVRRHRRKSRKRRRVVFGVLCVLALFGVLAILAAIGLRGQLTEARAAMTEGRAALASGDAAAARGAFERASSAFIRARSSYRNPVLQVVGYIPIIGRTPDALGAMIEAGSSTATAGIALSGAVENLPGGISAMAPRGGEIPLEPLESVAPALREGTRLLESADAALERAPSWLVLGPVDDARDELAVELDEAVRLLGSASALTEALPEFLGAGDERRYFVAAQNPAELRGTGGFIGAFAILTARDGKLTLSPFRTIAELTDYDPREVEPPNADYARRYDEYGGAGFWRNINMTPDFPSAATAIERLYERSEGEEVDGVIAADPFALAEMLATTGPVTVPGSATAVDSENVVEYLTHDAFVEFTDSDERKRVLGDVAGEVLESFLEGGVDPVGGGTAIAAAAAAGHLQFHAVDPAVQEAFETAGASGSLSTSGDLLALSGTNAVGNKIDHYLQQDIRYAIRLGAEGFGVAEAQVDLTNDAPATGEPAYVIGPYNRRFEAGENIVLLDTYCARTCALESLRRNGTSADTGAEVELGHPVFPSVVELPSGESESLELRWSVDRAWEGDSGHGVYRLTVRTPPTVRAPHLEVEVDAPEGMEIVQATPGMDVAGGRAVWRGNAPPRMTFEVRFELPGPARAWQAVLDFLGQEAFRLG